MSNASQNTKNDKAWETLFDRYRIIETIDKEGFIEITATQINEYREARLMTKFDHKSNLPELFNKNKLSILPITRGSYVISNFEAYKEFEETDTQIHRISFPDYIESIDYENITSEAMAINCAYISNIFTDFVDDQELLPTVNGRMSSNVFSFDIRNTAKNKNVKLEVVNSQVEIDGGYEGIRSLSIIEAKNSISDDFLIRQLFYPYRLWRKNISKKVKTIFLVYSNGIFSLYDYEFQEPNNYNSLVLVKQKNYSIEAVDISLDEIVIVLNRTKVISEPELAFPQADSFKRVINLCELLLEKDMARDDITTNYDFDPRQTNYYTDAARYLGLIDKRNEGRMPIYSLSEEGRKIIKSKYKTRQLKFAESILKHYAFRETLKKHLEYGVMPSKNEIVSIMKSSRLYNVGKDSTYERRASTVAGWINWILELQR